MIWRDKRKGFQDTLDGWTTPGEEMVTEARKMDRPDLIHDGLVGCTCISLFADLAIFRLQVVNLDVLPEPAGDETMCKR
jgi:hypothetical protein